MKPVRENFIFHSFNDIYEALDLFYTWEDCKAAIKYKSLTTYRKKQKEG